MPASGAKTCGRELGRRGWESPVAMGGADAVADARCAPGQAVAVTAAPSTTIPSTTPAISTRRTNLVTVRHPFAITPLTPG